MLCRHNGFSVLSQPSRSSCLQGFFLSFYLTCCHCKGQEVKKVQWGWWHLLQTNYIHDPKPSFLCWCFELFWYSMMNYRNQMRGTGGGGGWEGGAESMRLKEKIQEEFFAFTPPGRSVCWWSTVRFSGKRISTLPTHASLSNQMKSQRRSSFMQSGVCVLLCCAPPLN